MRRETFYAKQSQFVKGPNGRNVLSKNGLWRFCRFETAEKQSQFKANFKGAPTH
jgi:hypothetical protein